MKSIYLLVILCFVISCLAYRDDDLQQNMYNDENDDDDDEDISNSFNDNDDVDDIDDENIKYYYDNDESETMSDDEIVYKNKKKSTSGYNKNINTEPFKLSNRHYNHLVFEGGGSRAIAYIGALKALKSLQYYRNGRYLFEKIGGTSSGCFMSFIVALDIDPLKIEALIHRIDIFTKSLNFDIDLLNSKITSDTTANWFKSLINSYKLIMRATKLVDLWQNNESPGLSSEEKFTQFIHEHILPLSPYARQFKKHKIITFYDIYKFSQHKLACFATRLTDRKLVEFSVMRTPKENVFKAMYASMTIPGIFKPLDDGYGNPLIDGSFINNFPITMNDSPTYFSNDTLGFSLMSRPKSKTVKSTNSNEQNSNMDDDDDIDENMILVDDMLNVKHDGIDSSTSNSRKYRSNNLAGGGYTNKKLKTKNVNVNFNTDACHNDDCSGNDRVNTFDQSTDNHVSSENIRHIHDDDVDPDNYNDHVSTRNKRRKSNKRHETKYDSSTTIQVHDPNISFKFKKLDTFEYATMMHALLLSRNINENLQNPENQARIIYLSSPLKTLDFNIETRQISDAITRAYIRTRDFLHAKQRY